VLRFLTGVGDHTFPNLSRLNLKLIQPPPYWQITKGASTEARRSYFHLVLRLGMSRSVPPVAHVFILCTRTTLFHTSSNNLFTFSFFSTKITKAAGMQDGNLGRNGIHFGALKHKEISKSLSQSVGSISHAKYPGTISTGSIFNAGLSCTEHCKMDCSVVRIRQRWRPFLGY
jgi:hypothetical protein